LYQISFLKQKNKKYEKITLYLPLAAEFSLFSNWHKHQGFH